MFLADLIADITAKLLGLAFEFFLYDWSKPCLVDCSSVFVAAVRVMLIVVLFASVVLTFGDFVYRKYWFCEAANAS